MARRPKAGSPTADRSAEISKLRNALLDAQFELRKSQTGGVVLIVTGIPAAGRSETVNELLDWLDPKFISVHALRQPDASQRERPPLWRYWVRLPPRGRVAVFFGGWYGEILLPDGARPKAAPPKLDPARARRTVVRIRQLEAMLRADAVHVAKIHLHIDRKTQRARLKSLRASRLTRWRVTREDLWLADHYKWADRVTKRWVRATDRPEAPWHVIDGTDPQARLLAAGRVLLGAMEQALQPKEEKRYRWPSANGEGRAAVRRVRFDTRHDEFELSASEYRRELQLLQGRFALLTRRKRFARGAMVLAFEGMDAAGKGGAIKRLTRALDARQFTVVPVGAPTPEELSRPYLWRFWRPLPRRGETVIFDRSWYGRVLVERVRALTPEEDWQRAYDEIREFERQLVEHRIVVHKFWLAVSGEEQLERFRKRDTDVLKRFKVDPEDWANRRYFTAYEQAAREMIDRTHTVHAPWTVVEADDKRYARLKVLRTVCEAIERELDG